MTGWLVTSRLLEVGEESDGFFVVRVVTFTEGGLQGVLRLLIAAFGDQLIGQLDAGGGKLIDRFRWCCRIFAFRSEGQDRKRA